MTLKEKSWLWLFTFPFAHANYTTIGETIYYPKGLPPPPGVIAHETIHSEQQKAVGLWKFLFLYLFALPFIWNPWRFRWEFEAYTKGSRLWEDGAEEICRSWAYGFLRHRKPVSGV